MAFIDIQEYEDIKNKIESLEIELQDETMPELKRMLWTWYLSALNKSRKHYESRIPVWLLQNFTIII